MTNYVLSLRNFQLPYFAMTQVLDKLKHFTRHDIQNLSAHVFICTLKGKKMLTLSKMHSSEILKKIVMYVIKSFHL